MNFNRRLPDIEVVIRHTLVYSVTIILLLLIYAGLVVASATLIERTALARTIFSPAVMALLIAFLFQPLREWVRRYTDHLFCRGCYDARQVLAESIQALGSKLDLHELLTYIVDTVARTMNAAQVTILLQENGNEYRVAAAQGISQETQEGFALSPQAELVRWLAENKEALVLKKMRAAGDGERGERLGREVADIGAEVCLPLVRQETLMGVLTLSGKRSGQSYSSQDIELLGLLASQAAVAIENARLYTRMAEDRSRQELLRLIGRELSSSLDVELVMSNILQLTASSVGARYGSVMLLDENGAVAHRILMRDLPPDEAEEVMSLVIDKGLAGWVIRHREGAIVYDTARDPRWLHLSDDEKLIGSALVVPLSYRGQLMGVVSLLHPDTNRFTAAHLAMLNSIARQAAIAVANANLFDNVRRQAEELAKANQLKSEFLANLSHELLTPLNPVLGYIDMLLANMHGPLTTEQRNGLERARQNALHLKALISDMLDIAQIQASQLILVPTEFSVHDLMSDVAAATQVSAEAKGLAFAYTIAPDFPSTVVGDYGRVRQVVLNLVSNAIKFTPTGEVRMDVRRDGDRWVIAVRDTGIGIPENEYEHIFEEFRQVDGSATREYGGTGMGLSIVKKLVTMMKGTVTVDSELGVGSVFTVTLPIKSREVQSSTGGHAQAGLHNDNPQFSLW